MAFYTKIVWNSETLEIIERVGSGYVGTADLACGATRGQKTAAAQEASVAGSLNTDFQKIFGDNSNILKSISGALTPVVDAGPSQYGFSNAEDAALRTQGTAENASAARNATNAVRSSMAARGGGNTYMPTGSEAAIEGQLAESQAEKQADTQLGITEKGYDVGRQNFFQSTQDLAQAPGALENPEISAGTAAEGAARTSMEGQTDIANANNAWMAPVGGLIGSLGSAALTGGMGGKKH